MTMMISAPTMSPRQVVEKYFNMRLVRHTATHQRDLAAFAQRHGPALGVAGVEEEYYRQFRERVAADVARYERERLEILNDPSLDPRERRLAINKLDAPLQPAWGQSAEAAFIHSYGDPRASAANFLAELSNRGEEQRTNYNPLNGQDVYEQRTPWELHVARELTNPRDGSIAVGINIDPAQQRYAVGNYSPGWQREMHDDVGRSSMETDWGGPDAPAWPTAPPPAPSMTASVPLGPFPPPAVAEQYDVPAPAAPVLEVPAAKKAEPAPAILDANGNVLVALSDDPATRKAQVKAYEDAVKVANSICRYCQAPKPRGLKAHEQSCARRHGAEYTERTP